MIHLSIHPSIHPWGKRKRAQKKERRKKAPLFGSPLHVQCVDHMPNETEPVNNTHLPSRPSLFVFLQNHPPQTQPQHQPNPCRAAPSGDGVLEGRENIAAPGTLPLHYLVGQMSISPSAIASRCFVVLAFLPPIFLRLPARPSSPAVGVAVPEPLLSSKWPSPRHVRSV